MIISVFIAFKKGFRMIAPLFRPRREFNFIQVVKFARNEIAAAVKNLRNRGK